MASSESQARLTQAEPAKWIVVYKNGDQHFAGRRMVVKPREIKTFDHLLEEVTVKLSPSFGAVRNIFTPEGGTRVSSLTDLKPNGKYVASPNEPFRQLSRTKYGELPVQSNSSSQSHVSLQPLKDKPKNVDSSGARRSQHAVPSRYREAADGELTIHVYRNGDAFSPAVPLRVDRLARTHWQQTLTRLGDKLKIGRGVHKLYNLKGQLVRDPAADLEHNGLYVAAADNEGFRLVNYGTAREPFKSVTRGDSRSSTPHLPCPHQRIAESAPSVCAADSQTARVAATPSTSSSPPRRAPLPPLRLSYPELAHRYSQLKDKCALRALHRDEQKATASPAQQEATRKYHTLRHHYHRPHVQPKALRPPPRRVEVAPIDLAPTEAAPAPVESDGPFSSSSSNTDVDDGSMVGITYPELSQPELDAPRPEPFYLHPLPESGEADSTGRHRSRSSESDKMERLLGSALTSPAGEQWQDERHEQEPDGYIVTEPHEPAPEREGDLSASHSAPHLSRPASRANSREAVTPRPSDPNILTPPQPHRRQPRGTGFYSPGYSPLPEPRRVSRAGTPRTPAPSPVAMRDPGGGRLAVGDGSSVSSRAPSRAPSRPASRAASEPRLDSALSGDGSQCEIELVEDEDGELRCVSVLSRASSVPELPSPGTPEFAPVVMDRLAPRATLRAPVSRGESPAAGDSGRMSRASARSEDGGSATPTAGVEDASPASSPSERSLLIAGRDLSSSETIAEEATSPDVIFEDHISPGIDIVSPHPPSTCEDVLSTGYDELTPEQQPLSAPSRDSNKLTASCRQSPVTPELRRPLLAYPVYRDLVLPGREPSVLSGGATHREAEVAPTTAQSLPGVRLERSAPKLSPKAMSVDQMPKYATSFTQTPVAETPKKPVQAVATQSTPPPPAVPSPIASSPEMRVNESRESPAESQESRERHDSAESRTSRTAKPLSSSPRASPENQPELSPPSSAERGDRASNPTSSTTESRRSAQPAASIAGIDHKRTPPSAAVVNPAEPRPPPLPSPRRRRSASESSPLSAPGTAAGSSGWVWDEVPARPSDRAALAVQPAPPPPQAPPAPPAALDEVAAAGSGSRDELKEPEREESPGEAGGDVDGSHDESPSPPELPGLQEELQKLADQPVWPPTRTNSPEKTDAASPQLTEGGAESPVPRSATATLSGRMAEPAVPMGREAEAAPGRGADAAPVVDRGAETAPADIGQKLDEIASLLRTLLLQNMTARQAADGGSGAAPPLAGLTEEQLRALLLQPAVAERAGDSPPHKPR